jgi:integrase
MQLARHSVLMEDGSAIIPRVMTLKEWLSYWLENMYAPRAAETSVYGYKNMIDRHIVSALGNMKLQKLKPMHIQKYYTMLMEEKGLSPNTVIKHHDLLNSALKAAVKQEYMLKNPLEGVDRPKKKKHEASIYTPEQLQTLFRLVEGDRLETAVKLGAYLGLRREEICGLKWDDIDFEKRTLYIYRAMTQVGSEIVVKDTKTNASQRKLYIPDGLLAALKEEHNRQAENKKRFGDGWKGEGFVIVWEDGHSYRPNYISELFTKFLKENGLPKIVLHELRHTFASISNEAGVQEFNIGKALGHANVGTTKKIYTHLFDQKHTAAVDAVANMIDGKKEESHAE